MMLRAYMRRRIAPVIVAAVMASCSNSDGGHSKAEAEKFPWEDSVALSTSEIRLASDIDTFFQNKVRQTGFNGSVLVAREGRVVYRNTFGIADRKTNSPLTDSSQFQIASVTKPFTATAILQLYEKKKLLLDDPVNRYLKDFPYDSVTIRMLLSHRSGLPNYIYLLDTLKLPADSFLTNRMIAEYFAEKRPPLQATPGRRFQYSNSNYAVLALLIEKVSGQSYREYLQRNIFHRCHMYHTFVRDVRSEATPLNQTQGYYGRDWNPVPPVIYDGVAGDKGIYSTPYDLFLFDQALNHGLLLKEETLAEAYRGYSYEKPGIKNYGLGWRIKEFPDGDKLIYHNGWWRGYNSSFERRPDSGICVVVLTNKFNRSTYNLSGLFDLMGIADGTGMEESE
jgi:CubicO group peptidase (beta-lactamase class C family)